MDRESFEFFDLPDVVIRKILKEYVPVATKAYVLNAIPQFSGYLELQSSWFPRSLGFFRMLLRLKPGWHGDSDRRYLYHLSVDEEALKCKLRLVNLGCIDVAEPGYSRRVRATVSTFAKCVSTFENKTDHLGGDDDDYSATSAYQYLRPGGDSGHFLWNGKDDVRWNAGFRETVRIEDELCVVDDRTTGGRSVLRFEGAAVSGEQRRDVPRSPRSSVGVLYLQTGVLRVEFDRYMPNVEMSALDESHVELCENRFNRNRSHRILTRMMGYFKHCKQSSP